MYPAGAVHADENVCSTLTIIYHIGINLNSWGIPQPILSLPEDQGGYAFPAPKIFLQRQISTLRVRYLSDSASIPKTVANDFPSFQNEHGFGFDFLSIFHFQKWAAMLCGTLYFTWHGEQGFSHCLNKTFHNHRLQCLHMTLHCGTIMRFATSTVKCDFF